MKLIGYIRVSTAAQASEGVSLEAQEAKIRAYCTLYDHELVALYSDAGHSAKTLERPAIQDALAALGQGDVEGLIVAKMDRLTRRVKDLGDLLDFYFSKDYALLSVAEQFNTTSAAGRLVLNVLMSVAQWEREIISERTSEALQHKKAKGEYTGGGIPYGSQVIDGRLMPLEAEKDVIEQARLLRESKVSLRGIAGFFTESGIKTRNGNSFSPAQISRMLKPVNYYVHVSETT